MARLVDHCHWQEEVRVCRECGDRLIAHVPRDFANGTQRAFARDDCNTCQARLQSAPAEWKETL